MIDKLKALAGLLMTIGSMLLVIFKWFRGAESEHEHAPAGAGPHSGGGEEPAQESGLVAPIVKIQDHLSTLDND